MKKLLGFALVAMLGIASSAEARRPSESSLDALFYGPGCNPILAEQLSDKYTFGEGRHYGDLSSANGVRGRWWTGTGDQYGYSGVRIENGEFLIVHGTIKDEVMIGSGFYLNLSSPEESGIYLINQIPDCKPPDDKGKSKPDGKG